MQEPNTHPPELLNTENLPGNITEFVGRIWWIYLIGGIAAVIFGVLAMMNPGMALLALGIYFAVYLLVDGIFNIIGALTHRDRQSWWLVAGADLRLVRNPNWRLVNA